MPLLESVLAAAGIAGAKLLLKTSIGVAAEAVGAGRRSQQRVGRRRWRLVMWWAAAYVRGQSSLIVK